LPFSFGETPFQPHVRSSGAKPKVLAPIPGPKHRKALIGKKDCALHERELRSGAKLIGSEEDELDLLRKAVPCEW
jgi:hypothetical protein